MTSRFPQCGCGASHPQQLATCAVCGADTRLPSNVARALRDEPLLEKHVQERIALLPLEDRELLKECRARVAAHAQLVIASPLWLFLSLIGAEFRFANLHEQWRGNMRPVDPDEVARRRMVDAGVYGVDGEALWFAAPALTLEGAPEFGTVHMCLSGQELSWTTSFLRQDSYAYIAPPNGLQEVPPIDRATWRTLGELFISKHFADILAARPQTTSEIACLLLNGSTFIEAAVKAQLSAERIQLVRWTKPVIPDPVDPRERLAAGFLAFLESAQGREALADLGIGIADEAVEFAA